MKISSLVFAVSLCGAIGCGGPPTNTAPDAGGGSGGGGGDGGGSGGNSGNCDGGVACAAGEACARGLCLPRACTSGTCLATEVCFDGGCVLDSCVGVACPPGQRCAQGQCLAESCNGSPCPTGEVCFNGACVEPACVGVGCPSAQHCVQGACQARLANGSACSAASECRSGHCVDSVCCDSACAGPCDACSAQGNCSLSDAGTAGSPPCAPYLCSGTRDACPSTCVTATDCSPGAFCSNSTCVGKLDNAAVCAAGDNCTSGFCANARCCDSVCNGPCDGCDLSGAMGVCSPQTDGTPCGSGLVCSGGACGSRCFIAGQVYAPGAIKPGNACQSCQPQVSTTSFSAAAGTCDDGDACTQTDGCQGGVCTGSNPVTCSASDQCHDIGTCSPATGVCSNPSKPDGSACGDGNACTQTDQCQAGLCIGSNPVICTASDQCHLAGTCAPATGACSSPNNTDGSACTDGISPGECYLSPGSCSTGTCVYTPKGNGAACTDDGNACTYDRCNGSGACTHVSHTRNCGDGSCDSACTSEPGDCCLDCGGHGCGDNICVGGEHCGLPNDPLRCDADCCFNPLPCSDPWPSSH